MKSLLLFLLLVAGFSTHAQISVFISQEKGPLLSISNNFMLHSKEVNSTAWRYQEGILVGVKFKNRINLEASYFNQFHSLSFKLQDSYFDSDEKIKGPELNFVVEKILIRLHMPLLHYKKWDANVIAGISFLSYNQNLSTSYPNYYTVKWTDKNNQYFETRLKLAHQHNFSSIAFESGLNIWYNFMPHLSVGAIVFYQNGLSTMRTTNAFFDGLYEIVSNSKCDAAVFSLTARYTFTFNKKEKNL